jgi:hypothetical protein
MLQHRRLAGATVDLGSCGFDACTGAKVGEVVPVGGCARFAVADATCQGW